MKSRVRNKNKKNTAIKLQELFMDVDGSLSSKRMLMYLSFIILVVSWSASLFAGKPMVPQFVFDGFLYLVIAGMGTATVEKFSLSRDRYNNTYDYQSLDESDEPIHPDRKVKVIGESDPEGD